MKPCILISILVVVFSVAAWAVEADPSGTGNTEHGMEADISTDGSGSETDDGASEIPPGLDADTDGEDQTDPDGTGTDGEDQTVPDGEDPGLDQTDTDTEKLPLPEMETKRRWTFTAGPVYAATSLMQEEVQDPDLRMSGIGLRLSLVKTRPNALGFFFRTHLYTFDSISDGSSTYQPLGGTRGAGLDSILGIAYSLKFGDSFGIRFATGISSTGIAAAFSSGMSLGSIGAGFGSEIEIMYSISRSLGIVAGAGYTTNIVMSRIPGYDTREIHNCTTMSFYAGLRFGKF
jgi:hypothetical protein